MIEDTQISEGVEALTLTCFPANPNTSAMKSLLFIYLLLSLLAIIHADDSIVDAKAPAKNGVDTIADWMQSLKQDVLNQSLHHMQRILSECQNNVTKTINLTKDSLSSVDNTIGGLLDTIQELTNGVNTFKEQMANETQKMKEAADRAKKMVDAEITTFEKKIESVKEQLSQHTEELKKRNVDMDTIIDQASAPPPIEVSAIEVPADNEGTRVILSNYLLQYKEKILQWKNMMYGIVALLAVSFGVLYMKHDHFKKQVNASHRD